MSALGRLERAVQASVLAGHEAGHRHISESRDGSVATRLGIYRNAYYQRLTEALATTYPALKALLGDDQFQTLARRYSDVHPSRHYSIRYFGHRLAAFLATEPPYVSMPALSDVARWEWAVADVFDAADSIPLTAETLQRVPPVDWANLSFVFHDAIRLISSRWNVAAIWSALNREQTPPEPALSQRRQRWCIWRSDLQIYFAPLAVDQELTLRAAMRGEIFARICARAPRSSTPQEAARWAAGIVRSWVDRGWISRCVDGGR
jgi:putative DNA-binding protein